MIGPSVAEIPGDPAAQPEVQFLRNVDRQLLRAALEALPAEFREAMVLRELEGFSYKEIEARGLILVVTEVTCRYRAAYQYDDEVLIRTYVDEAASRAMRFGYELLNGGGDRVHATGNSMHVWVDRETRRPVIADEAVMKAFAGFI